MTAKAKNDDTPFHEGEIEVQRRLGVYTKSAKMGRMMIRDHMTAQHRKFYADLSFLIIGAADDSERIWASALCEAPGFLSTPDDKTLSVATKPLSGDPICEALKSGADIGVLGLMPDSRRRNRLTGRIGEVRTYGFDIDVSQSFGNCPQYIQARTVAPMGFQAIPPEVDVLDQFDANAVEEISTADVLFIASAYRNGDAKQHGADVSHRGGKPGFVKTLGYRSFVFPDFRGNDAYNTIGNIVKNPKTGFLFINFQTGDLLTMTGESRIVWDGPEVDAFKGAQRLIQFEVDEIRRIRGGFAKGSSFISYAPQLAQTGEWTG